LTDARLYDNDIDYQCVDNIFECRNVGEIKTTVTAFIAVADEVREAFNGMFVYMLRQRPENAFAEWAKRYRAPTKGSAQNAVIVPPDHSPMLKILRFDNPHTVHDSQCAIPADNRQKVCRPREAL
jgi:hypothetical protein